MLRLEGGRVVCPITGTDTLADVVVDGDRIAAVGNPPVSAEEEVIDCRGAIVCPGFVDLFTDFGDPGTTWREGIEHGSLVAAAGGYTTVVVSPATSPIVDNPSVVSEIVMRAREVTGSRVQVAGALTKSLDGIDLSEIGLMVDAGCVALSDGGRVIDDARVLRRALQYVAPYGRPIFLRPGDNSLESRGVMHEGAVSIRVGLRGISAAAEEIGVGRAIALCRITGVAVHLSQITLATSVRMIAAAMEEGIKITASVPARSLLLTDEHIATSGYETSARLLPPLRPMSDVSALRAAVQTFLSVTSDHTPWTRVEKELEFAYALPGAIGLETAAGATWRIMGGNATGFVQAMSVRPGQVIGLRPTISPGACGDLTIFDPTVSWHGRDASLSRGCNEPLRNEALLGRVAGTVVAGKMVYRLNG